MTTSPPPTTAMIAARRREAAAKEVAAERALAGLVRRREPITISAVAAAANVSLAYLSRHPTLGPKIRAAADANPSRPAAVSGHPATVEAALRHHIRGIQAAHQEQLAALRDRLRRLERENAALRGELVTIRQQPSVG